MKKVEESELFEAIVRRYSQLGEFESVVRSDLKRIIDWARADVLSEQREDEKEWGVTQ